MNFPVNKIQHGVTPDTSIVFGGELLDIGVRVIKWYDTSFRKLRNERGVKGAQFVLTDTGMIYQTMDAKERSCRGGNQNRFDGDLELYRGLVMNKKRGASCSP